MTELEEKLLENEFKLAEKLKHSFCDNSGKEVDVAKSAEIIYQIGSIYRKRSPHKLSLIKSVGLYNAAIARNPSCTSQIKSDLCEVCSHILKQANAKDQSADLVNKAETVKATICELRNNVRIFLKYSLSKIPIECSNFQEMQLKSNKISSMQQINKRIADKYQQIMADLSQYCQDVMGNPPCEFAVVGMGSLARSEITPYSDFEHIILLFDQKNYKAHLNYFRWYSVIFHIVLLNLQETIIPGLNIQSLNDTNSMLGDWYYDAHTSRGISFDGMMPHACKFPLGRQQHTQNKPWNTELIKPVSEMLEFLSSESDLKNGYHLADILTKTCFVFGNKTIFNLFSEGVENYQKNKTQSETIEEVRTLVKDDLNNFSTRFRLTNFTSLSTINIKQLVYRSTTIFIAALARVYNMKANSSFDVINEMEEKQKITANAAHKLHFAIATACEMRLRVYTEMKSQCDNAVNLDSEGVEKFLDIAGVVSTINYFQIAYCLQCEVAKQLNFSKLYFYSDPQLINITICLAFGIKELTNSLLDFKDQPRNVWDIGEFDFDSTIQQIEVGLKFKATVGKKICERFSKKILSMVSATRTTTFSISKNQMLSVAQYLYSNQLYDEAFEFYNRLLKIHESESKSVNKDRNVAKMLYYLGNCHRELHRYDESLKYLKTALKVYKNSSSNKRKDRDIASTLDSIGITYMNNRKSEESLTFFQKALSIKLNLVRNEKSIDVALTLNNIGLCYMDLKEYVESLYYIKQALEIYQKLAIDKEEDRDVASTLNNIGYCLMEMQQYSNSLTYYQRALIIIQNTSPNKDKDCDIARTLSNIGNCHFKMQNFDQSLTHFTQALRIFRNKTVDGATDCGIARTLNNIGTCHMLLHQYEVALTFLKQALKIRNNIVLTKGKDQDIASTLKNIGFCLLQLHRFGESITFLENALNAYKELPATDNTEHESNVICSYIEECSKELD